MLRGLKNVKLGVSIRPKILARLMLNRSSVFYAVKISALISDKSKARPRTGDIANGLIDLRVFFNYNTFRFLIFIYLTSSIKTNISV
jgi:hypothetical protein